ncbi:MAG: permease, partial [Calditrichaceae bacterium]
EGFWYFLFNWKWIITSFLGFLFAGSLLFILKIQKWMVLGSTALVIISHLIWPDNPLAPFITAIFLLIIILSLSKGESADWMAESWSFAKQILPLLALGVLAAGFLLGTQDGGKGIIPNEWIASLVGGNSVFANFFASIVGAFMYFAALTEIPILQGLINAGMGKGPALALLLAGPALSLPNMLVIRGIIGTQKTIVYVSLVVIMATLSGIIYGSMV